MTPKCTPTLGVAFAWKLRMFKALVGKQVLNCVFKDTIRNVLKHRCLKCPRIVHLDLICMNYNQKKGWESN